MIRNILIIAASGVVLYSKAFKGSVQQVSSQHTST